MNNDMLNERLRALDPVDRVVVGEKAQVLMREILEGEGPRPARRRGRLASSTAALVLALAVGTIATTPGQSVTGWVGQRVGISSPGGGTPSLQPLRDFAHQGASPAGGQPATVVARGSLPYGRHYELVAYRPKPSGHGTTADPVCFELDFPEVRSIGTLGCALPASGTALANQATGESATATQSFSYATGLAAADVGAVDVTVRGRPADVHLVRLHADVLKRFGIDRPIKLYMATFATGAGGPVTVTIDPRAGS
jgi:hypothetical protein